MPTEPQTTTERLVRAVQPAIRYLDRLDPLAQLTEGKETMSALLDVSAQVAARRRAAVRELRMQGWKLQEIANELGVSRQQVSNIERGKD